MMGIQPYCEGVGCPISSKCRRHKQNIDRMTEQYFASTPYDHNKNKCGFFVGTMDYMRLKNLRTELNINNEGNGHHED